MAKAENAPVAAEAPKVELREVKLVRDYVPENPQSEEDAALRAEGINQKVLAGTVIALPIEEARKVLRLEIAKVDADLI